jgi:hypothetical protein
MSEIVNASAETIEKYLDRETDSLLLANGVYNIGNYGWLSDEDIDPDAFGHAMWQTDPPLELDWETLNGCGPVRHRPTEKQKLLSVAGNDFEGLMQASRLSIGLCLFHRSVAAKNPLHDNHYFWLHHTNSILQLDMASDRIRDYFTVAFHDKTQKEYNNKDKYDGKIKYNWYTTPFVHAADLCRVKPIGGKMNQAVAPLPAIAAEIHAFRELRNEIVHEISTRLGRREKEFVEKQQKAHDVQKVQKAAELSFEELVKHHSSIDEKQKSELFTASETLVTWYKKLTELSGLVFETEYWLRKSAAS